jgi:predicted DNA binding protein
VRGGEEKTLSHQRITFLETAEVTSPNRRCRFPDSGHSLAQARLGLRSVPSESGDALAVVKVRFRVPREAPLSLFVREFPDAVLNVLASGKLPRNRDLVLFDVLGPTQPNNLARLRAMAGVISVSILGTRGTTARYLAIVRRPRLVTLASDLEALLRFPQTVTSGWFAVEVVARVSQLRELVKGLRRLSRYVEVVRFGHDPMRSFPPTLTSRQHFLLHQALAAGYFDVPRRVTLTGLATQLHRSKSSLSQTLARVERELVESSATQLP